MLFQIERDPPRGVRAPVQRESGWKASYQKQVAQSVSAVNAAGARSVEGKKTLDGFVKLIDEFKRRADKLQKVLEHEGSGSAEKHAKHFRDSVIPAMEALRIAGDELELIIPHELWPLATYREMLFIK